MREVEQAGQLGSCRHFALELVASLPQLMLDPASSGAERADHDCKQQKDDKHRPIRRLDVERVQGLGEEVVEAQTREGDGHDTGHGARIPERYGDGHQKERELHFVDCLGFSQERKRKCDGHGDNGKPVFQRHGYHAAHAIAFVRPRTTLSETRRH